MPNYWVHTSINFLLLSPAAVGAFYLYERTQADLTQVGFFFGGYLFSTVLLSPDLDLATSAISKHWGRLGFVTKPYSKVFHHGQLSHQPVIGTLTRYVYLMFVVLLVLYALSLRFNFEILGLLHYYPLVIYAFVGSTLADSIHSFLDAVTTNGKVGFRKHGHG